MTGTAAPVVRTVVVPCDPAKAFALFTGDIAQWWPADTHSVGGADVVSVSIEPCVGGRIAEHVRSGSSTDWGTVTTWDPPGELAMTWHPGYGADRATDVRVTFAAHPDGGTVVELVHSGWERLADGPAMRSNYESGWVTVLSPYAERAGASAGDVR